ncbi:VanZ family protein [Clostridium saccharobutylicum]|uniref:Putative integral membrane protein n=1 Tax=Clostridium saccharobutylicum DSM 13864 TaxID=1345695 RepID=U5MWJ6_CLOSA|nr:VanZ family protein [Clostridium saccharobutylicum]AGX45179.1 putative integral membrane protein [Clostridium saccharobutylicum DSM 13864]AQR92457.1 VanZ like family protein [Clostridium saccharobutylicum]AQS02360.1 VanZ like family protein [Clostridium saccharobutylicum]AQS11964.1 VanZ like family protein [Clostridium saccharobutylicum]AQS16343.1 VanZ like family protein [Clostridium saccharobutylicum]
MKKIVILLCIFWIGFIFYMSSNNGEISHEQSTKVVDLIENKAASQNSNVTTNTNKNTVQTQQLKDNKLDHIVRKNAHAFMYMVLAILVSGMFFRFNKKGKGIIIYILFICLFYAVTDEFHQSFVPGRTSLVSDILVDFGGALIGLTLFYLMYYKIYPRFISNKK